MTTSVSRDGGAFVEAAPQLLDPLFYAVSHDLRSPLLTVSLSAQLLEHTRRSVVCVPLVTTSNGCWRR